MPDDTFDGSVGFRVKLGVALLVVVILLVVVDIAWVYGGYSQLDSVDERNAVFSLFLAASAAAIATFAAVYAKATFDASQLQQLAQSKSQRVSISFDLLRMIDESDRYHARSKLRAALGRTSLEQSLEDLIAQDEELARAVVVVLGSLEDISIAIRVGHADEQILFVAINHMLVTLHENLRSYIAKRRGGNAEIPGSAFAGELYGEFQAVAEAWKRSESAVTGERLHMTAA